MLVPVKVRGGRLRNNALPTVGKASNNHIFY
jgi:small subunit ribosomal protein S11